MIKLIDLLKETIKASEAHRDESALQTVVDGKRDLGFNTLKNSTMPKEEFLQIVKKNNLKLLQVPSNPNQAVIYYRPGSEKQAEELKDIAEKYNGYLSYEATEEDSRRIGELLGYEKEDIDDYIIKNKKMRNIN